MQLNVFIKKLHSKARLRFIGNRSHTPTDEPLLILIRISFALTLTYMKLLSD